MPRFFVSNDDIDTQSMTVLLTGENAHHVSASLRMKCGEELIVCDGKSTEYECTLFSFEHDKVRARIDRIRESRTEPPYRVSVYQALPKGDKLDTIIQKSVECGAFSVTTFESEYCVAREKNDSREKKLERRRKISAEAAKQCGRGIIPDILPTIEFESMISEASKADIPIFCYEGEGTLSIKELLHRRISELPFLRETMPTISIVIGSEGGFSAREAELAKEGGMLMAGLGNRILRAETVSGFVLAVLAYEFEL